ncbi:AMP-binding protein [Rhodococcus sp. 14-2470-1a]|uniref:AMP-binding protein n=1 Tax=Rhodococcus sp. 14-2470-1a TaxID=2023150 RepID=UPI000B9AD8B9|nr:AMP-binding protein [Rhodococcus sp. 14-2470-1a]OZF56626.1 peptide synthetase [Rhodococcus sp. 14-2470-1a]
MKPGAPSQPTLVHHIMDDAAARTPDATAVTDSAGQWTYRELADAGRRVARWLLRSGIGHGDRVLVQIPSVRATAAIFDGVVRIGAIFVPVNPGTKEFHLRSVLSSADPSLIIGSGASVQVLGELVPGPVLELDEVWPEMISTSPLPDEVSVDPEDVAVLVYTSGSTAAPKGVVCPHRQMVFASQAIASELGYRSDDVVFCRFPISWDYGLYKLLLTALVGAEIVLADGESDLVLLERIRQTGATVVPIVPSFAAMVCRLAARADAVSASDNRVRMFTNTGAALADTTADELRTAFPGAAVIRQFGQTECKRISVLLPEDEASKGDSVGKPLPGTAVVILNDDGTPCSVGVVGEIVVTGPHVMPGYWRAPELTERTFRTGPAGEARLHTGDYGSLDADGFLYYEGRRDDMFKRKGVRMSVLEIEAAAMDVDGVTSAAAVPPADGRDLGLVVTGTAGSHVVLRELSKRLEPAKVPSACRVVDQLPLTLHGKYERRELVALLDGPPKTSATHTLEGTPS